MMLYAGMTVLISLLLVPVASMGWLYLLAAIGLGGWFLGDALRVMRNPQRAMVMFTNSTYYLALIFLAAMVDVLARSIA
jgi:protoheme IX farnesyltransferase